MPVQEINVIDARHLDQPKPVPYRPPTVITVVRAGPEQRDGEAKDYRQYEMLPEELYKEAMEARGEHQHTMAIIDRMLEVELQATGDDRDADGLLWSDVGSAIPAVLWEALTAARVARAEASGNAGTAWKAFDAHRSQHPASGVDIDQWAQTRAYLEQRHGALEQAAAGAQAAYLADAAAVLTAVREVTHQRLLATLAQDEPTRGTVADLRAQADRIEREHQLRGAAISRLLAALNEQGMLVFEEV